VPSYILKLKCPDKPGIVASISQGLLELDSNILRNSEYRDEASQIFTMRCVFEVNIETEEQVSEKLQSRISELGADVTIRNKDTPKKALIMVSKFDHCLLDIFYRIKSGELNLEIAAVVSNHPDLKQVTEQNGFTFKHIPVTADNKEAAEQELRTIIDEHQVEFVTLARYMQILSPSFCSDYSGKIINIHHSFLPGFKGADPYQQAHDRGVKLIGATAHYVTAELDEGPIIAQDVTPVSHLETKTEMATLGRDVERVVLSKAIKAHCEDRIFSLGNRTIVFQ